MFSLGDIPTELYRWFLLVYGTSAAGRVGVESYKQIAVLKIAWYDVPVAALGVLEEGFVPHVLLSIAVAEVSNMVLGALMKRKARTEGRAEANQEWRDWLRRKNEAERSGQTFDEPAPDNIPDNE